MTAPRRAAPARMRSKNLVRTVRESVGAMPWLHESDQAAVELAVALAEQIEASYALPLDERASAVRLLAGKLLDVLSALGATARTRADVAGQVERGGKLASLRAARDTRAAGDE